MIAVDTLLFALGATVVAATFGSAMRTTVLPRGVPSRLARLVFVATRRAFLLRVGPRADYARRDRILALYAPLALLVLGATWLGLVLLGYAAMFFALGDTHDRTVFDALAISGSSIFTLGFDRPSDTASLVLSFTEAALGLLLLTLLITYLPSIYTAFSRRENAVTKLEVRAGSPPTGVEMIERAWRLERLDLLTEVWEEWEDWFVTVEETHTSFAALTFFRSPQPDHSWVGASGAVLDGAALHVACVHGPRPLEAELCIRAGYLALRRIADYFRIGYDPDPRPDDPISIDRHEFDEAWDRLAAAGVPLKPDRERAWRDWAGWRVNYDTVLLALATLTMAPYAPWSSDRGPLVRVRIFGSTAVRPDLGSADRRSTPRPGS